MILEEIGLLEKYRKDYWNNLISILKEIWGDTIIIQLEYIAKKK